MKQYKKNLKEKQQSIEIMEEDKKFMASFEANGGFYDGGFSSKVASGSSDGYSNYAKYTELSQKYGGNSKTLADSISKEKVAAFGIETDINHLQRSIGDLKANIRNASSAMKTLTLLGAY